MRARVAGALVLSVGIPLELAVRKSGDAAYRVGVGVALVAAFILVWVNGPVGIIGSEDNDANLMMVGCWQSVSSGPSSPRFRRRGMARALFAAAFTKALIAVITLIAGLGAPANGPREIVG